MELIALIVLFWVIGCAFPGSGQSHGPDVGDALGFIACAILLAAMFCAYWYAVAAIIIAAQWLELGGWAIIFALLGPIAIPMLIAGVFNARAELRAAAAKEAA